MSITRPEDKRILKYWLPFGFMRRYLARTYGMTVRYGRLVKGNVLRSDVTGFHPSDIIPLGMVMLLHRIGGKAHNRAVVPDSEIDSFARRINQLTKTLEAERKNSREQISALEVENLKLKLFVQDIAKVADTTINNSLLD